MRRHSAMGSWFCPAPGECQGLSHRVGSRAGTGGRLEGVSEQTDADTRSEDQSYATLHAHNRGQPEVEEKE